MDFPDDLKLSPVGLAPPLPSTPPIPPARTRPSRRLPQVPTSQNESRPNSRPTIARKPSIEVTSGIVNKRQQGKKSPAPELIHSQSHHESSISPESCQFSPQESSQIPRAKPRTSKMHGDIRGKGITPSKDIVRTTSPSYGLSSSRESSAFDVSSSHSISLSSSRESPLNSISRSKESPIIDLSISRTSPPHSILRESPPKHLSNSRHSPKECPQSNISSPKECPQSNVSSLTECPPCNVPSPTGCPPCNVSSTTGCPPETANYGSSPKESLSNGMSRTGESPSPTVSSPDTIPSQTISSPEAIPTPTVSSPEVRMSSPSNALSSQRDACARISPSRGLPSARSSPPNKVSCSSDSSPRLSVKCLAENCEQISSYVSKLVISDIKSSPASSYVSQLVISDIKSSQPAPNNVNQEAVSDVDQLVISDKEQSESEQTSRQPEQTPRQPDRTSKQPDQTSRQPDRTAPMKMAEKTTSPTKPVLKKADAIDIAGIEEKKKMERGISHATGNEPLVLAARNVVQQDFQATVPGQSNHQKDSPVCQPGFIDTPLYTFTLPDLTNFPEDFRGFLEKDLIELSALISLEQSGRLNWWADTGTCQRLWPLATTGDGNCLLHAASLGMWGFHDRLLTLRKALYTFLTSSEAVNAIYRRWRWQASQQNLQSGLSLTEAEWEEEWSSVLRLASTEPRPPPASAPPKRRSRLSTVSLEGLDSLDYHQLMYESLEEVHVLVLAHVLRRPIVIVADTILKDAYGEALAPIPFGGIYLPLEVSPSECHKCPLLLTYDAGHFSALVGMQSATNVRSPLPTVIPLTDSNHSVLPIQFCVDPGEQLDWGQDETNPHVVSKLTLQHPDQIGLLKEFLDVLHVPLPACFLDPPPDSEPHSPDSPDPCHTCVCDAEAGSRSSEETNILQIGNKSKTAKQIQSVAKQFGSIGKTVSKKLKKNLGTITKIARSGSFKGLRRDVRAVSQTTRLKSSKIVAGHQDYILTAIIHTNKCLPYHQEMVANYLEEAKLRFDKDKELKVLQAEERRMREEERLEQVALAEGPVQCINPDCQMMGNALTSYLCSYCYYHQMRHETDSVDAPHVTHQTDALYGSGRSKFYVNADESSYKTLRNIPVAKHATLRNNDRSIYLANSTFYRDNVPLVVPVSAHDPDPPPIVPVSPPQQRNSRKKWLSSSNNPVVNGESYRPVVMEGGGELNGVEEEEMYGKSAKMKVNLPGLSKPCKTEGCSFFGTSETNYFCSKCFKESQRCVFISQASQV